MRQCAQCVGRVIRGKNDYGLMIFADKVNINLKNNFYLLFTKIIRDIQKMRREKNYLVGLKITSLKII